MARNVEIKARLKDFDVQFGIAKSICESDGEVIHQEDVFFACDRGRLKLRIFSDDDAQLIYYVRPDQLGPKTSNYVISATREPNTLRNALNLAYGETAVVKKKRLLFMYGRTRIHLDQVEGLGDFLELEVVLKEGESVSIGENEAKELMQQLSIQESNLVESAYVDLLACAN